MHTLLLFELVHSTIPVGMSAWAGQGPLGVFGMQDTNASWQGFTADMPCIAVLWPMTAAYT